MADKLAFDNHAIRAPSRRSLTLLIDGKPVGRVRVERTTFEKIFGLLIPGPGFEPFRNVFEAAVGLSRQIDLMSLSGPVDAPACHRLMDAYGAIHRLQPVLEEYPMPIEEFAIDGDWSVEITFVEAKPH
jgi:hypothetical protein